MATPSTARSDPERFDPDASSGLLVEAEHRARYLCARALVAGRRVLDAGCGTGYGARLLADSGAAHVCGVDLSQEAVEHARRNVDGRAEITLADLRALPFEDDSFDVATCFEVIEHVDDREKVLHELRRVLKPDGTLVISSPNRDVYTPGNPHHVFEYTPEELEADLRRHFAAVRLHAQHPWLASAVADAAGAATPSDGTQPAPVQWLGRLEQGGETYTVAVAAATEPPALEAVVVLADAFEVRWWHEQVSAARMRVADAKREAAIAAQERDEALWRTGELGARLARLAQVEAEVEDLRRRCEELRQTVARYDTELNERGRALEELPVLRERAERAERINEAITSSPSWRLTAPLRALKSALRR